MIKICAFSFDELQVDNHWVSFSEFGEVKGYMPPKLFDTYEEVPEILDPEEFYQISFDQSTSCTGIFIKNYKNTEAYMIEVSKNKNQDADAYIFDFDMFVHRICKCAKITHLIYERPIATESFRSAQVLFQLEGTLRAFVKRYSEFKTARLECIENSSWRRVVILEDYKRMQDRKLASENSIKDLYPWTTYYDFSLGSDRDIFEAMGVMFGWFFNSYDRLGRPYVRGDRYNGAIGGFILPEASAEEVSKELKKAGIESTWFVQNPRKSTFENLACAVEKYKVVCVELNEPHAMLALTIECNIVWMDPARMTIVLTAANFTNSKLFEITGKEYHFVL